VDGVKGEGQHTEAAPADHGGDSHLCSRTRRVFPKTCPKTFPKDVKDTGSLVKDSVCVAGIHS